MGASPKALGPASEAAPSAGLWIHSAQWIGQRGHSAYTKHRQSQVGEMAVSAKITQRPARPRNWLQNKQNGQQAGSQHGRESGSQTPSADRCVALSHHSASLGPFPHTLTEGDRTSRPFQLPPALTSWTCCHKREVRLQTTHHTGHILYRGPLAGSQELGGGIRDPL